MPGLSRIGLAVAGLALLSAPAARAGMPVVAGAPWSPAQQMQKKPGLFKAAAERLCGDCQRRKVMEAEGVRVPPPPALPPGTVIKAGMCTACGKPAAVVAGRRPLRGRNAAQAPAAPMMADNAAPGRAVVGGEAAYASNGSEPMPIGAVQPRLAAAAGMGMGAGAGMGMGMGMGMGAAPAPGGPRDGSVMPTSMASDPLSTKGHPRPHVLTHMLGLDGIGRERSMERERRKLEEHAMIPYGQSSASTVNDVPARAVYGR